MSRLWILLLLLVVFTGCGHDRPRPLTIAAAANLRLALEELSTGFTRQSGITTELVFASSGKLTAQIQAGAPYDLFLSADERFPAKLAAASLTSGKPVTYAHGRLALWTHLPEIPLQLDSLASPAIQRIALANPATAPYGKASVDLLKSRNLFPALSDKIVYGESIGQANQFVYSGAAEVGFTALSTVISGGAAYRFLVLDDYPPIVQTAVVVARTGREKDARKFLDFLLSPAGRVILVRYGYLAPA